MPSVDGDVEQAAEVQHLLAPGARSPLPRSYTDTLPEKQQNATFKDAMTYHMQDLSSLTILFSVAGTVWHRSKLWFIGAQLFFLSICIAVMVLLMVHDPAALKVSKFSKIATFLSVFVGLMLGFFMSTSMSRWYECARGLHALNDSIMDLQMQLYALGVDDDKIDEVIRYGVLSAWLLSLQLRIDVLPTVAEKNTKRKEMWDILRNSEFLGGEGPEPLMYNEDEAKLKDAGDPSGVIWMWVAAIIGNLAQDGDIPGMASPTYGRIMAHVAGAHDGIRMVHASITVQAPYIYVHTLASLVHINNIINAISFGMTWGASLGTTLMRYSNSMPSGVKPGYDEISKARQVSRDAQDLIVSFFFSCFGPFIYLALLEVSIAIAQPFSSTDGEIPTQRLLITLENDLNDAQRMAKNLPNKWSKPRFKALK